MKKSLTLHVPIMFSEPNMSTVELIEPNKIYIIGGNVKGRRI